MTRQPCVVRVMILAWALATTALAQTSAPDWVEKFPQHPDEYIGIGRVSKQEHPGNYRELAHASALSQISGEISTHVKSEASAVQAEDDGGMRESYAQKIMLASANDLAGYRTAETYETGGEYWVLVVLEKSVHEKFLNRETDDRIARLKREIPELQGDLRNRRFQNAMDRYADMRRENSAFTATRQIPDDRRALLDSLCDSARGMLREAARHPLRISLDLQSEGSGIPDEALSRLRSALSHLQSPFYKVTQKIQDGTALKIRILGMDRDTLEGMIFTSMRGEVCWPNDPIPKPIRGKSGHPNRERSLSLAVRDFVMEMEQMRL